MYEVSNSVSGPDRVSGRVFHENPDSAIQERLRVGPDRTSARQHLGNRLAVRVSGWLCLVLLAAAPLLASGCDDSTTPIVHVTEQPQPSSPVPVKDLPPGTKMTVTQRQVEDGGTFHHKQVSSGASAGLETDNPEVAGSFDTSAPSSSATGSIGGASSLSFKIGGKKGMVAFIVIGVILCLGAGFCVYRRNVHAATVCGAFGIGFIVIGINPAILFWVAGAAGVIGLVMVLRSDYLGSKMKEGLRAVTAGVEDLDPDTRKKVKAKVASHADAADLDTIRKIKKEDGLPSERHPGA